MAGVSAITLFSNDLRSVPLANEVAVLQLAVAGRLRGSAVGVYGVVAAQS